MNQKPHSPEFKERFFINFTVIFLSLQDNPAFQNYRGQYEGHRVV
jgi:hypothetical protein